jgi:hypothetical protein
MGKIFLYVQNNNHNLFGKSPAYLRIYPVACAKKLSNN